MLVSFKINEAVKRWATESVKIEINGELLQFPGETMSHHAKREQILDAQAVEVQKPLKMVVGRSRKVRSFSLASRPILRGPIHIYWEGRRNGRRNHRSTEERGAKAFLKHCEQQVERNPKHLSGPTTRMTTGTAKPRAESYGLRLRIRSGTSLEN